MRADEDTSDHIVTFPFRLSYYEAIMAIPESERMAVFDAIFRYAFFGEKSELEGIAKAVYIALKPNIACSRKWVVSGSKGGRPRKKKAPFTENKNPLFGESETPLSSSENPPFAKPERGVTDSPKPNRTGTGNRNLNKDIPVRTTVVCPSGTDRTDRRPVGVNSYDDIYDPANNPIDIALTICQEEKPRMAAAGYIRQYQRIGDNAFRVELASYWGELEAGEIPRNRGSALMARLQRIEDYNAEEAAEARRLCALEFDGGKA